MTDDFPGISEGILDAGVSCWSASRGEIVAIGGYRRTTEQSAEIAWMGVDPDHHRHGYGEGLLEELEPRAAHRGIRELALPTFDALVPTRRLYR